MTIRGEVRWGFLGCGDVTERKSGPAFQRLPGSRVVAVMRRDAEKARSYAERHGIPRWYARAEDLLADREVNAVYVATPPSTHAELAIAALRTGRPVYVEKPMARTSAECAAMLEASRETGAPLFVAHYRRALPRFLHVKSLLDAGAIGEVRTASFVLRRPLRDDELRGGELPWRVRPEIAGGGHFVDLASHTLDLLDHLLGPIAETRGFATNQARIYPAEDAVACALRFRSGVLGTCSASFAAGDRADAIEIAGSRGSIRFATFADEPVRLVTASGVDERAIPNPDPIQGPLVELVVRALRGEGESPSTGESAARTVAVIDAILADHRRAS